MSEKTWEQIQVAAVAFACVLFLIAASMSCHGVVIVNDAVHTFGGAP